MSELEQVERDFEAALIAGDTTRLADLLDDALQMITPIGSVMTKPELIGLINAGVLKFEGLGLHDFLIRLAGDAAVVTGKAHMRAAMGGEKFEAHTRYTHAYVKEGAQWRMIVAQGTPIQQ